MSGRWRRRSTPTWRAAWRVTPRRRDPMPETDDLTIPPAPSERGGGLIDLDRLARATLTREPFEFVVVPGFVPRSVAEAASCSFPGPDLPGVLPAPRDEPDTAFGRLLRAL